MGFLDGIEDDVLVERHQTAGVHHFGADALSSQGFCGLKGGVNHERGGHNGYVRAFAFDFALAKLYGSRLIANFAFNAVQNLVFEKDHGVVVADGADEQALGVCRGGGDAYLDAGNVHEPCFKALGVLGRSAHASALGHAQHHGHLGLAAEHVVHLGGLVKELVKGDADEVHKHQFGHGAQTGCGSAGGSAHNGAFRNGGVAHAAFAKLVKKALSHAKAAAKLAHVFTDDEHVFVPLHLLTHGIVKRLQVGFDRHIFLHSENLKVVSAVSGKRFMRTRLPAGLPAWGRGCLPQT